jgi:hypothetical protein
MKKCVHCGGENGNSVKFCEHCGKLMENAALKCGGEQKMLFTCFFAIICLLTILRRNNK